MGMTIREAILPWEAVAKSQLSTGPTILRNPTFLFMGVIATVIVAVAIHVMKKGRGTKYKGGIKAANTKYAKALPEYVSRRRKLRVAMTLMECLVISSLVSSFAVMARPSAVLTEEGDAKKRDIFLCLDISYSIFAQNEQLVDSLKDVVAGLNGERFGVTVFNSSSVMYVPMTDDYNYVMEQLDALSEYFRMQAVVFQEEYASYGADPESVPVEPDPELLQEYKDDPVAFETRMAEVEAGVTAGVSRGSSIIGEGLATCLYSFPHLDDEDRTRVIIMSTDNDSAALYEDVSFEGAGDLCAKHGVTVYGIFPSEADLPMGHASGYDRAMKEFGGVCDETNGKLYVAGHGQMDVKSAVSDIKSKEAITIKEPAKRYQIDTPGLVYGILLASVTSLLVTVAVMRPW